MPSGKVHDSVTFGLALPAFGAAFLVTDSWSASFTCCAAFLFGGLMFGPDLDTISRPYTRWGPARAIWLPYRYFFSHRSRFSHGLVFGALIRVVYFMGAVTMAVMIGAVLWQAFRGGQILGVAHISTAWAIVGDTLRGSFGENFLMLVFAGLWLGAASHSLTDIAGSYVKTGRPGKLF